MLSINHSETIYIDICSLKNDNALPLAVGGWLDHVHVLFEFLLPDGVLAAWQL